MISFKRFFHSCAAVCINAAISSGRVNICMSMHYGINKEGAGAGAPEWDVALRALEAGFGKNCWRVTPGFDTSFQQIFLYLRTMF